MEVIILLLLKMILTHCYFFFQDLPATLKCRRRFTKLLRKPLDPRIVHYIDEAGLSGLYGIPFIPLDHALITALVERWRPETHTFHLPHGEMTITLEDMEVMMGLPIEGLPVVGKIDMKWKDECESLLGVTPPPSIPKPNQNKSVLDGSRIKLKWLADHFRAPLPENASENLVQQYARYYILELLGGSLFMDTSGGRVSLMFLQFLDPISDAKKYSWGSAALAWLYRQLCNATHLEAKQIGGPLILVQLWAFARFPHMFPKMKQPCQGALDQELLPGPYAVRYITNFILIVSLFSYGLITPYAL